MAYSTVASVKAILLISADDESFDDEIGGCISSADALVDGLLKKAEKDELALELGRLAQLNQSKVYLFGENNNYRNRRIGSFSEKENQTR